jgi:hypothetical protein
LATAGQLAGGFPSNNLVFVSGGLHIGEIHSNSVLNGTLLTNVLVPDRGRIGFRLPSMTNTVETATPVAQLITITGGLEPQDERNLLIQRSIAAGTVRVDLTNVVLKPGSVLAVNEDSANVRTALILEGTATLTDTADSDVFDLLSLTASNPGDPRTVILGRTNATDDFPATSPFINGAIGDNFTFEMINMGLRFSNSATLGANMVINNLGTN